MQSFSVFLASQTHLPAFPLYMWQSKRCSASIEVGFMSHTLDIVYVGALIAVSVLSKTPSAAQVWRDNETAAVRIIYMASHLAVQYLMSFLSVMGVHVWFVFTCVSQKDVGMWHAGTGQPGSSEALHCSVQTAGGGRAADPVPPGGRDPNRQHGREHPGVYILMHGSCADRHE